METDAMREIVLIRHGRSAHVEQRWLDADALREWMRAYDAAGIAESSLPPPELIEVAKQSTLIASSDLPRAMASATALVGAGLVHTTPLLREAPMDTADLPLPRFGGARLPLGAWALVFGWRWIHASLRAAPPPGVDATVLDRAERAVDWLTEHSLAHDRILAVTHATIRTVLADALVRRGWERPVHRSVRPWSAWRFVAARDDRRTLR